MKQVLIRGGRVVVETVPAPLVEPRTILVRTDHSCISPGTELSGIRAARTPLWRRAAREPGKVGRVLDLARTEGVTVARDAVKARRKAPQLSGYSLAGVAVDVGSGIEDIAVGDRVACAGNQYAFHAEVVRVPRNLTVRVPDQVSMAEASTVSLGAIALHGVRRAQPSGGETFAVIGLGFLGQLTVQLLQANGCRVIGVDVAAARVRQALELGMDEGMDSPVDDEFERIERLTGGFGVDGAIITAAAGSSSIVSSAFRMCRQKGRVVLVGDVGLHLVRDDIYAKELDFLVSTSYGPGRYDRAYEEDGVDYPIGYVRWTENRNMAEYLRLIADGRVRVAPLIGETYPIDEAAAAYAALESADRPLTALLSYPAESTRPAKGERIVANPRVRPARDGQIRVAVVGAGEFAKAVHLPNLRALDDDFRVRAIVSRSGPNATVTAEHFGAQYAATDVDAVLGDPDVDLVVIATRHDLHARLAVAALKAGKHVLVEKPLALTREDLDSITGWFGEVGQDAPVLMTGFNRRFSPYARRIAELIAERVNPLVLTYRMNAGYVAPGHWIQGPEGGGRNRGEACHIYDLFTFLTGARVTAVQALAMRPATGSYKLTDNFTASLRFEDGSVANLTYTALGAAEHPKEQLEVFVDGRVIVLDDYRRLTVSPSRSAGLSTRAPNKGQREELQALAMAVRNGGPWPIALWQQVQATEIALAVESQLTDGA